jgi:hypothetical protein
MAFRLFCWIWIAMAASAAGQPLTACRGCHRAETESFASGAMPRALVRCSDRGVLGGHARLSTRIGAYSYEIARSGDQLTYSVTDGKETIRALVDWAFGRGDAGQTYVFQRGGEWFESRVSYYSAIDGLDATLGAHESAPGNLLEAAGRRMSPADTNACFGCHATNAVRASVLTPAAMQPGVWCESCHGSAGRHLQAMNSGQGSAAMPKLGAMTTEEMSDFCGRCHRSWSFVAINGPRGIANVRFQPYRLALSKCYDPDDRRIRCTACHDPHRPAVSNPRSFDPNCIACHSASSRRACPVARQDCVTCHMPKIDLPGAHKKFTDHRIRIAQAGSPYPD